MKNKKLKRFSLINLITGYIMLCMFVLLIIANREQDTVAEEIVVSESDTIYADDLFNGAHPDELKTEILEVGGHPVHYTTRVVRDSSVGHDFGVGVVLDDEPNVVVIRDGIVDNVAVVSNPNNVVIRDRNNDIIVRDRDVIGSSIGGAGGPDVIDRHGGRVHRGNRHIVDRDADVLIDDDIGVVDVGALERAVYDAENDRGLLDRRLNEDKIGLDVDENFGNLTLANDNDDADFVLDIDALEANGRGGKGYGLDKGQLYAYNFPSQGVGAGIGSSAVGAGIGAAGIGAGIGQAVLDGQTVPTLGGIGTSATPPLEGEAAGTPPSDGVGGLACGAGAGGAAGLTARMVTEKLGLGVSDGKGCAEHGEGCEGHHGHGNYDYDHLPKDGALHIMMHVDGSGSILNTRKQLELMKETLLKDALLPYYNNNESLYDRRVTIVSSSDERSLQFYTLAAKKDNVLAVAFQDEASPVYHLPTFNKKPQDNYSKDLGNLKASLNGYGGLYRGIIFQVDRGRTFSKSFKQYVECAWNGDGYLKSENLKKYHRDNNLSSVKNKEGIVFSDEYHVKSEGDPQYYLNLIFEASKRIGLDLNIYGAGQTDGKYNDR